MLTIQIVKISGSNKILLDIKTLKLKTKQNLYNIKNSMYDKLS